MTSHLRFWVDSYCLLVILGLADKVNASVGLNAKNA